ncbi:PEP-CTERM sorting domain-containing protein [Massilia sp. SR12]
MALRKFFAGIAVLVCASSAQAAPVSLSTTLALSEHLHLGQNKALQLNVNSLLAGLGVGSSAIKSGTLTVLADSSGAFGYAGFNSTGYQQTSSSQRNVRVCLPFLGCGNRSVTDTVNTADVTQNYLDLIADTMRVRAGNSVASDSVDWHDSYGDFGTPQQDFAIGTNVTGYSVYRHRSRHHNSGYSGALSINLALDTAALGDLSSDGLLGLNIWSSLGRFDLSSIRLDFTVEKSGGGANDIPLPGSLLLSGLGLAALGVARRRQRRA